MQYKEKGREFLMKWIVITAVLSGSAALVIAGMFDGQTADGISYPNSGAVQVWMAACASAIAGAGIAFAGRSYVKGKMAQNGSLVKPETEAAEEPLQLPPD